MADADNITTEMRDRRDFALNYTRQLSALLTAIQLMSRDGKFYEHEISDLAQLGSLAIENAEGQLGMMLDVATGSRGGPDKEDKQ